VAYGGALYYTCEGAQSSCEVDMQGNSFRNNTSTKTGGAVKWADREPLNIEDGSNDFEYNVADVYGDDIASFP
jgi:hypothetical protein